MLYNDSNWLLYAAAGNVNITDTEESCDAAARINVAAEFQNHCVEFEVSYIDGGHVNLNAGYHYHGANGCSEGDAQSDGHAPAFGYAWDGYAFYSMLDTTGNESMGLDSCRGHSDDVRGYHYHAASPGKNMFIACFTGETVR